MVSKPKNTTPKPQNRKGAAPRSKVQNVNKSKPKPRSSGLF